MAKKAAKPARRRAAKPACKKPVPAGPAPGAPGGAAPELNAWRIARWVERFEVNYHGAPAGPRDRLREGDLSYLRLPADGADQAFEAASDLLLASGAEGLAAWGLYWRLVAKAGRGMPGRRGWIMAGDRPALELEIPILMGLHRMKPSEVKAAMGLLEAFGWIEKAHYGGNGQAAAQREEPAGERVGGHRGAGRAQAGRQRSAGGPREGTGGPSERREQGEGGQESDAPQKSPAAPGDSHESPSAPGQSREPPGADGKRPGAHGKTPGADGKTPGAPFARKDKDKHNPKDKHKDNPKRVDQGDNGDVVGDKEKGGKQKPKTEDQGADPGASSSQQQGEHQRPPPAGKTHRPQTDASLGGDGAARPSSPPGPSDSAAKAKANAPPARQVRDGPEGWNCDAATAADIVERGFPPGLEPGKTSPDQAARLLVVVLGIAANPKQTPRDVAAFTETWRKYVSPLPNKAREEILVKAIRRARGIRSKLARGLASAPRNPAAVLTAQLQRWARQAGVVVNRRQAGPSGPGKERR